MQHYRHIIFTALVGFLCVGPLNLAWAQDELPDEPGVGETLGGPALMTEDQIEGMNATQRSAQAVEAISNMRMTLDRAMALLDSTRAEERDVLKLNCINEKISALKGFLKVAEQAQHELDLAVADGDGKNQVHQMTLVMLAATRVQILGEETESCAGEIVQFSGDLNLEIEVDEDIRTDNPSAVDTTDVIIDPLPDASPYQ